MAGRMQLNKRDMLTVRLLAAAAVELLFAANGSTPYWMAWKRPHCGPMPKTSAGSSLWMTVRMAVCSAKVSGSTEVEDAFPTSCMPGVPV